jgi:hypothetical protein
MKCLTEEVLKRRPGTSARPVRYGSYCGPTEGIFYEIHMSRKGVIPSIL